MFYPNNYPMTNNNAYTSSTMNAFDRFNQINTPNNTQQPVSVPRVNGLAGANAYYIPPNSNTILMDNNQDIFYLKVTDSGGYPTVKEYEYKEKTLVATPQFDVNKLDERFVTRDELKELMEKFQPLQLIQEEKKKGDK